VNDVWNAYCDVGVGAHTARSHGSEDLAEVTVWYEVTNPGPNDVTVTSKRWSDGEGRWGTASVPVPAGETRTLSVTGLDVCDGAAAEGPLRFGLVLATVPGGEAQPVKSYEGATDRGVCNNLGG
jgi:hypothetical protein